MVAIRTSGVEGDVESCCDYMNRALRQVSCVTPRILLVGATQPGRPRRRTPTVYSSAA